MFHFLPKVLCDQWHMFTGDQSDTSSGTGGSGSEDRFKADKGDKSEARTEGSESEGSSNLLGSQTDGRVDLPAGNIDRQGG